MTAHHHSVRFTLLDQQVVDAEDRPVGRVDDLVIQPGEPGQQPVVTELLIGAQALGERLGGVSGHLMARVAHRLSDDPGGGPTAVPVDLVGDHTDLVHLIRPLRDLPDLAGLERWLAARLIEPLPGAGDARL
jgi:hypothetical protein